MIYKKNERGQAIILVAFAVIAIFGFAALAIDGSRAFSNKRNAQNAADGAVLAAALKMARGGTEAEARQAAMDRAASNNFDNAGHPSGYSNTVTVDLCSAVTCEGLPPSAVTSEYIRVRVESTIPTTFARVIGRQSLMGAGEAIAHVGGGASYSFLPGNALVSLSKTGCGICGHGSTTLNVTGSGIFSNSSSNCSDPKGSMNWGMSGTNPTTVLNVSGGYTMATGGAMCWNPAKFTPGGTIHPTIPQIQNFSITVPEPSFSCAAGHAEPEKVGTVTVYHPGTYDVNETISRKAGTTEIKFEGNYCFNGFVKYTGTEKLIMTNANIRSAGGAFQINAAGPVTCSNVMVFSDGGTGVQFAGSGSVNCQGITFYMKTGNVKWNGGSSLTLNAPTSASVTNPDNRYKGLLLYMPEGNHSSVEITGNNSTGLTGTILTPGSTVALAGTSGAAGYNTQIIADTIDLGGTSDTVINYNPANQYIPPPNPTIQLTK